MFSYERTFSGPAAKRDVDLSLCNDHIADPTGSCLCFSMPSTPETIAGPVPLTSPEGPSEGMISEGFSAPMQSIVKPLTPEALATFKTAQEKAGIVYISRIPPGMRPTKVRHLMSAYGEVGRVYLQQEGTVEILIQIELASWLFCRCETGVPEEEIYNDKKAALYGGMD